MPFLQKRISSTSGSFGETLKELRELRCFTREQVGKLSGIHPHILKLLEEDRIDELADPSYDERHVYAIAKALETNPAYLIQKYQELLEVKGISRSHALFPAARVGVLDLFVRARAVAFVGFIGLVVLIGGYVYFSAKNLATVPHLQVDSPKEGAIFIDPTLHVSGSTDPGAFVFIDGSAAVVDATGTFSAVLDVPRGVSIVHVEAKRRYGPSAIVDLHVTYAAPTSIPALDALYVPVATSTPNVVATSTSSTIQ
jgi:transcriptional regulator with XRE-family HTH domain